MYSRPSSSPMSKTLTMLRWAACRRPGFAQEPRADVGVPLEVRHHDLDGHGAAHRHRGRVDDAHRAPADALDDPVTGRCAPARADGRSGRLGHSRCLASSRSPTHTTSAVTLSRRPARAPARPARARSSVLSAAREHDARLSSHRAVQSVGAEQQQVAGAAAGPGCGSPSGPARRARWSARDASGEGQLARVRMPCPSTAAAQESSRVRRSAGRRPVVHPAVADMCDQASAPSMSAATMVVPIPV